MLQQKSMKGWLYLLPALIFLGLFLVYPLIDVFIYSFEEGYNSASQTSYGVGLYNFSYILHDPYFLQALKNSGEPPPKQAVISCLRSKVSASAAVSCPVSSR